MPSFPAKCSGEPLSVIYFHENGHYMGRSEMIPQRRIDIQCADDEIIVLAKVDLSVIRSVIIPRSLNCLIDPVLDHLARLAHGMKHGLRGKIILSAVHFFIPGRSGGIHDHLLQLQGRIPQQLPIEGVLSR